MDSFNFLFSPFLFFISKYPLLSSLLFFDIVLLFLDEYSDQYPFFVLLKLPAPLNSCQKCCHLWHYSCITCLTREPHLGPNSCFLTSIILLIYEVLLTLEYYAKSNMNLPNIIIRNVNGRYNNIEIASYIVKYYNNDYYTKC